LKAKQMPQMSMGLRWLLKLTDLLMLLKLKVTY
jgi:hypothetical protein